MKIEDRFMVLFLLVTVAFCVIGTTCGDDDDDDSGDDDNGDDDDNDVPAVIDTEPDDGAIEQRLATQISMTFSTEMDTNSVEANFHIVGSVTGDFSWDDSMQTMTFTPSDILHENTEYTVTIGTGAQAKDGTSLADDYVFSFWTVDLWTRILDGGSEGNDTAFSIGTDNSFRVAIVATIEVTGQAKDIWVRSYNRHGDEIWTDTINGEISGDDRGYGVAVTEEGVVYAGGLVATETQGWDAWLRKYNVEGNEEWTRTYNGTNSSHDVIYEVALNPVGGVAVCGYERVSEQRLDIWIRKYNASGDYVWTDTVSLAGGDDRAFDVAFDPDGNMVVVGQVWQESQGTNIWVRKYNNSNAEVWTDIYDGDAHANDGGLAAAMDADGYVYATGEVYVTEINRLGWIRKYSPDGDVEWTVEHNGPIDGREFIHGVVVDIENNVYVCGVQTNAGTGQDIWVAKLDSEGDEMWSVSEDGEGGDDHGLGIALDTNANVYVTGKIRTSAGTNDIWTRKFDTDGNWAE